MPILSPIADSVPTSGIRRIFELAQHLDGVIHLAVGEPGVPVDPAVRVAGGQDWANGELAYTPNSGIVELREAIRAKLARDNGYTVGLDQIHVTAGGVQALHLAMTLALGPGDELLIPNPGYTTFAMAPRLVGAVPVPYRLRAADGFVPDLDELESLITPRTRALLVNSPSNPLGAVYGEATLRGLVEFAARHDLWVVSDEVYEYLTYDEPHVSPAALDTDGRVLSVYSLSKTYALTGARVGYLVTPPGLDDRVRAIQETTVSCINTPAQVAAVAALTGDQRGVREAVEHYRGNLAAATDVLDRLGLDYLRPAGAFYLWIDVSHASGGDVAGWAERLLREQRVAVAPGSAFGDAGEGWIRACYAGSRSELVEGLSRLPARGATE